jgi:hypothetical protein
MVRPHMSANTYIIKSDKPLTAAASGKTVPGGFGQFPSRVRTLGYWKAMRGESRDVYPVLCDLARADNNFTFCASHQQIADDIGCSTKLVQRGLADLAGLGLIQVIETGRMQNGKAIPGTYRLLYPTDHASAVVSGHRCPEDTPVQRHPRPETFGHGCPDPVDTGVRPSSEKRSAESSRAEVAAASLAAPRKDSEQVKLLIDAGVDPPVARGLPDRSAAYLKGMIARMRRGGFGVGWLVDAVTRGNYSMQKADASEEKVWSVSPVVKRQWTSLSDERRSEGLRQALLRFRKSAGAVTHINDVIAGRQQPREWLVDEVARLTQQEVDDPNGTVIEPVELEAAAALSDGVSAGTAQPAGQNWA